MAVSVEKKIVATKHDTQKDAYLAANTAPASPPSKSGGPTLTLTKTPRRHLRRFLARRAQRSIFANFSGKCERSPILVNLIMGDKCCALNLQRHAA